LSVGLLTRVFPADFVDQVIAEAGRTEQRHRTLVALGDPAYQFPSKPPIEGGEGT
jgi:hypothetical protein